MKKKIQMVVKAFITDVFFTNVHIMSYSIKDWLPNVVQVVIALTVLNIRAVLATIISYYKFLVSG